MVTLQQAITQNQNVLGANFEHLGKSERVYLSYDKDAGWSVQKFSGCFGFVKLIFRWLGFYASTHLSTVHGQLQREVNVNPALKVKIEGCWNRQKGGNSVPAVLPTVLPLGAPPRLDEPQRRFVPTLNQRNRIGMFIGDTHISVEQGGILNLRNITSIVNAANEACLGGGGIDGAIHDAAGPELFAECLQLPQIRPNGRCETGQAVITRSGLLGQRARADMNIERIIHAVGPRYNAANPAESAALLKATYINSLNVAHANGSRSIAFPAISTGIFGYPFQEATRIAIQAVEEYAQQNPGRFDEIKFVFLWNYLEAAAVYNGMAHVGVPDNPMA
jgi:O-acetyl-ADP-ribose deacetylase (regulator of RNase III)